MQGKSRSSAVFPESRLRPENAPTYWRSRFARTTVPWPEAEKHRLWPRPTKCTSLRYRRQRGPRGVGTRVFVLVNSERRNSRGGREYQGVIARRNHHCRLLDQPANLARFPEIQQQEFRTQLRG